jgi:flagellar assembly protein FliH
MWSNPAVRIGSQSMLSKVLKDAGVQTEPVTWRRQAIAPANSRAVAADKGEAALLRATIAELESAAETKARQSYAAGVRAGENAARQRLEADVQETVQKLSATIAELAETRSEVMRRAEADMVRLSIAIARRVLHSELSTDGSALESLIKAALEKLKAREVHRVRVHPDQEQAVRGCLDQTGRGQAIAVVGDPVQPKGGAVFEINQGALDASVETQLAEIERGLMAQLDARV